MNKHTRHTKGARAPGPVSSSRTAVRKNPSPVRHGFRIISGVNFRTAVRKGPSPAASVRHRSRSPSAPDYSRYEFTHRELAENLLLFCGLDLLISWLFFHSIRISVVFLPGIPIFLRLRRSGLLEKRKAEMLREFTTGMQLVNASLQAGYAAENAFREALPELKKIYPADSFIVREFRYISSQTAVSVPLEAILTDLSSRCQIDDIRNFAEVFRTAKRSGGDLMLIIRNTVSDIQEKSETREQIEADLSGKVLEQNIMSLVPILIIGYVNLTSPDFLTVCYRTAAGRIIMTFCLAVYAAAFLLGRKIMRIRI